MMIWFALVWLFVVMVLLGGDRLSDHITISTTAAIYLWLTLVASGVCFVMYFLDKRAAQKNRWRISEKTLHTMEAIGGWPGALIGQQLFRHKTQKLSFKAVLWLIIAVHVIVVGCVIFRVI